MERLGVLFLLLSVSSFGKYTQGEKQREPSPDGLKLVCYYSNWAVYRPGLAKFTPQNINPYLCTHLIYAFGALSPEFELASFDPYNDIEQGNYKSFVGLKAYNPNLKTLIAVGGWNEGSKRFSKLVESDELRRKFIQSVLHFVREHNFDGLDLDWEYPAFREGGNHTDKRGYAQLIKEIRLAFDSERIPPGKSPLLLSVAVPATKKYIDMGFDVPVISKNADFLNLLTYDYHNAYEPEAQHHAPLYPLQEEPGFLNVEWTVKYYLQLGCAKEKIVVGIPMYGRSYTLANPESSTALGARTDGPGEEGHATRERGYLAFYEVCQRVKDEEWEVETPHPQLMGPYAFKGNQWVGFDDEEMISLKARFILDQGLGGAMVWTLDNDDFRGICTDQQSPLVNTLRTALLYSNVIEGSSSQQSLARSAGPNSPSDSIVFDNSATAPVTQRNTLRKLVQSRQTARRNRNERPTGRRVNDDQTPDNSFTTPVPPTTPDPGITFECKDEGFFNNPKDCKKYFWCLDSGPANLGVVAHAFTCPSGLYFNAATESCDYPENVSCRMKSDIPVATSAPSSRLARPRGRTTTKATTPKTTTTTTTTEEPEEYDDETTIPAMNKLETRKGDASEGENVAELLRLLQAIGGVDKLQSLLGSQGSSNKFSQRDRTLPNYISSDRTTSAGFSGTAKPIFEKDDRNLRPRIQMEPEEPSPTLQVPRKPQFEPEAVREPKLINDDNLFNYQEPPRQPDSEDVGGDDEFPFQYHNPTRGHDTTSGVEYIEGDQEGHLMTDLPYSPPPTRQTSRPTQRTRRPNEKSASETGTDQGGNYRAPIRVQVVRIPNGSANDNAAHTGIRRRMRVRVRPSGEKLVEEAPQPHQGRAISREEQKSAAAAAHAVLVHDPNPNLHAKNDGEARVAIRRKPPVNGNNVSSGTGVSRVVARSRRPNGDALLNHVSGQGGKAQSEGNYVAVRRVQLPVSKPQPTSQVLTTRSLPIPPTKDSNLRVRTGYQPPINKPTDSTTPITEETYAAKPKIEPTPKIEEDYDEEYEEYDEYVDEETTHVPPTTTTMTTTTTTTKKPQKSRSSGSRQLSSRRNRHSTSAQNAVTQSSTTRSTSAPRQLNSPQSNSRTRSTATTSRPRTTTISDSSADDVGVLVKSDTDVECLKRGVFIHPTECSKFIVCAPSSRSAKGLRGRVLLCPANQIYLEDIGRCMKGDRNKCQKL